MNADDVQILHEDIIIYEIYYKDEYIATTHLPDVAIVFCEENDDCHFKRCCSHSSLVDLIEILQISSVLETKE